MGRPPIHTRAMTGAQRQAAYMQRLKRRAAASAPSTPSAAVPTPTAIHNSTVRIYDSSEAGRSTDRAPNLAKPPPPREPDALALLDAAIAAASTLPEEPGRELSFSRDELDRFREILGERADQWEQAGCLRPDLADPAPDAEG